MISDMITSGKFIKHIAVLVLLPAITVTGILAQGTDSRSFRTKKAPEKLYFGINLVPKKAGINYAGYKPDTLQIKTGSSFDFSVEAGYYFSKYLGVSAGAGLSSFSATLNLTSYNAKFRTKDDDLEDFQMQVSGKNITENQKIGLLSIPVCLNCRYPASEKLNLFLNAGISVNIPIVKSYDGKGSFTYKGFYSAYPVTIESYDAYFPTDYNTDATGTLKVKPMVPGILVSAGASFSISRELQLGAGLNFNKSLGSISAYDPKDYRITSAKDDLGTIMGLIQSKGVQSVGLIIGLKYYLK
jgi:hypothetical protein